MCIRDSRRFGINPGSASISSGVPGKAGTRSRSPYTYSAGEDTTAPCQGAVSSQLRSRLRYQLSAPVKPGSKLSVRVSRSASVSQSGSTSGFGASASQPRSRSSTRACSGRPASGASPEAEYSSLRRAVRVSAANSASAAPGCSK